MKQYEYTALDVVALGGIAVIIGSIFLIHSNFVWSPLIIFVFPIWKEIIIVWPIIYGVWFIGATATAYIIRKPGAAFLGEFLGALVEMVLGSIFFAFVIIWGFAQGVAGEMAFALRRYKSWSYPTMMLAGTFGGIAAIIATYFVLPGFIEGNAFVSGEAIGAGSIVIPGVLNVGGISGLILWIVLHMISGAVIAGILTKYIIDKLALTGILDLFPIGKEVKKIK